MSFPKVQTFLEVDISFLSGNPRKYFYKVNTKKKIILRFLHVNLKEKMYFMQIFIHLFKWMIFFKGKQYCFGICIHLIVSLPKLA